MAGLVDVQARCGDNRRRAGPDGFRQSVEGNLWKGDAP